MGIRRYSADVMTVIAEEDDKWRAAKGFDTPRERQQDLKEQQAQQQEEQIASAVGAVSTPKPVYVHVFGDTFAEMNLPFGD